MDIGAIKARIADLEQRKAERNALRGYRDLSYLDYIAQGDRSGFDKIEADEVAYRNMLKHQAQQERMLGLQQDFTARENELNRINAQEIAQQNKATNDRYNEIKLKQSQATAYNAYVYAKQQKDMADKEGNIMKIALANKNLNDAKAGLQMLGINPDDYETKEPGANGQSTGTDAGTRLSNIQGKKSFKTKQEKADYIESIKQDPMYGQDEGKLEAEVQRLDGIKTQEEIDAYKKEAQDSYDRNVTKDSKGQPKPGSLAKWKQAYPKYAKALGK